MALIAALALFLLSVLIKLLLVVGITLLLVRAVGMRLAGRFGRPEGRMGWPSSAIISIDNPGGYYRPMYRTPVGRTISVS